MITATTWVPRGFAAQFPTRTEFNEEEFNRIQTLAKLKLEDAEEDLEEANRENGDEQMDEDVNMTSSEGNEEVNSKKDKKKGKGKAKESRSTEEIDDDLKEYNLDKYDDTDEEAEGSAMGMFGGIKSLAYYESNEDDPYITMQDHEDDSEREELQILATDNLLLAGKFEDDWAHLEVYVYEDGEDNLYVHHDINLPAIPLCMEWLDIPVGTSDKPVPKDATGNYVAVGTTDPDIEVWNLDTIDSIFPDAILGAGNKVEPETSKKKNKKKKKKAEKPNDTHHVAAVLALAANRSHRNLLASASADTTVKLWDLTTGTAAKSYTHHTDKVCALSWHTAESTVLLSGSWDRTVVAADMRSSDIAGRWGVDADVENVRWDPRNSHNFFVSTESGALHYHDARNAPATLTQTKAVWMLQAHSDALSAFDVCNAAPGLLATGSADKTVKLWNISSGQPTMLVSRDLEVGKVFSSSFAPDGAVGFRLAVAGSAGFVRIWDTSTNGAVRRAFGTGGSEVKEERIVGLEDDDSESDDDEGEEAVGSGGEDQGWESMDDEE